MKTACFEPKIGTRKLCLQLPDFASEVRLGGVATDQSIDDMVSQALDEPIEFPPLPLVFSFK